jgi:hypothetical protein
LENNLLVNQRKLIMVTSTRTIRSARVNKTASSKNNGKVQQSINGKKSSSENAITAEQLAKRIIAGTKKIYGVDLSMREQRMKRKVAYATREKLGKDIQAQLEKLARNGNGKGKGASFDWREWNTQVFTKLVGDPENLQYSAEVVANAMAIIYDSVPAKTEEAVESLIQYNMKSLEARNGQERQKASELDDLDDLDDLEDDDDIDELIDDEDEFTDELDEDDEEFELDDDDED